MMNTNINKQRPIEELTPTITQRVKFATQIAFSIESVKPHKKAVCQIVENVASFLDTYNDPNPTQQRIREIALSIVDKTVDDSIKDAARAVTEIAISEAFDYAWQYYNNFINQDKNKSTILIAKAVAKGMREACSQ